MKLRGKTVAKGAAMGPVHIYRPEEYTAAEAYADPEEAGPQLERYEQAVYTAQQELWALRQELGIDDHEKAGIFLAHEDMLLDEVMCDEIRASILSGHQTAEWAVQQVFDRYGEVISQVEDPVIRERADDLRDVRRRLLRILSNGDEQDISALESPCILVADDLLPSDTITMDRENVLGIATEGGGVTSHTAIITRGYGIPAIVEVAGLMAHAREGGFAQLNASDGEITLQAIEPESCET